MKYKPKIRIKDPRTPRARRVQILAEYGITYSGRQWVKLRKKLRRAYKAARAAAREH